jgi:hypothetical protein
LSMHEVRPFKDTGRRRVRRPRPVRCSLTAPRRPEVEVRIHFPSKLAVSLTESASAAGTPGAERPRYDSLNMGARPRLRKAAPERPSARCKHRLGRTLQDACPSSGGTIRQASTMNSRTSQFGLENKRDAPTGGQECAEEMERFFGVNCCRTP